MLHIRSAIPPFFLLLLLLIGTIPIVPTKAQDWYTEDSLEWQYRKTITVNGSITTLYNWTIRFWAINSTGTDEGLNVYLGSGYQEDLDDLRITEDDGTTRLHHWIDYKDIYNYEDSDNQTFYYCVPELAYNTTTTYYLYWGCPLAENVENGTMALLFWDDFDEDYEIGDDPHQKYHQYWTVTNDTPTKPDNAIEIVANPYTGQGNEGSSNLVMEIAETGSYDIDAPFLRGYFKDWDGDYEFYFDYEVRFIVSWLNEAGDGYIDMREDGTILIANFIEWANDDYWNVYHDGGYQNKFLCNDDTWYWIRLRMVNDGAYDYDVERDGTNYDADWKANPSNGVRETRFWQYYYANTMYLDHIYMFKHTVSWAYDPYVTVGGATEEQEDVEEGLPYELSLMYLDNWLALALNIDVFIAGLLLGLIILLACMSPLIFAKGERPIWATIIGFAVSCFNVAMGWFPVWELVVIVLLVALLYSDKITKKVSGD